MLIEAREAPGGGAGLGGALCQRSHVHAPQAFVRSGPNTLSDRALFLPRPSEFDGQRAIPGQKSIGPLPGIKWCNLFLFEGKHSKNCRKRME